ncbi:Nif11-like leader peptide family natural product precursor [Synechococcus sp. RS9916]|uniref:Nif11-like leader peptide family natural product precursor n=1 Tax=Synechococcus sp. RS9916 TaxID=221359 RepID=UPI0000E53E7D|nr:Nif11-like leader peptide family natural product precursor [Synechococcus sp. RS9916]EAU73018.1 possible SAP domain [Synechococcus sp. RS9916]
MQKRLEAFLEKVKADTSLQEKLKAAADTNAVVAIAKDAGFSISADDLTKAQPTLSEEELEGVAGGVACTPDSQKYVPTFPDESVVNIQFCDD